MKLIDVQNAELHGPLFLNGKSLGGATGKLSSSNNSGITMKYDVDSDRLFIFYKGAMAMTKTDVKNIQARGEDFGFGEAQVVEVPVSKVSTRGSAQKANVSATAQVSDPTRGMK